jgi:PAS domain S-box-containing protein
MGANANRSGQKGGGPEKRPLQPLRVLIVDDSEDDCLLVVQQLRCSGFKPDYRRVFTAEAMRNALASEPWEAIICDYAMPSFSALTALELFQKQQIDIPFIVVSGTVGEAEAVDTMKHGAHDYVMKNRLERLGEAVRREIQQARMRAESKQLETQKEHLRRVLQAIRNVNQLIVREKNRESLVQRACDTLVETRGFDRAWIVLSAFPGAPIVSGQTRIPEEIFSRFVSLFRTGELPLCCRRSSMENPVLFTQKTRTVCTDCPLGGNHNGTSALTTRIVYEGKLYGFLGVSLQSGLTATEEEMSLFVEMAGDLGFTLHNQEQEASLRVSEERYRRLFETMSQGVVYQDAQGVITFANPAAERILGLSLEQMTGRTSLDPRGQPIHEDGSPFPAPTHPARVALSTGEAIEGVVMGVFLPDEGTHRWIKVDATPLFTEESEKPFAVYTIFTDITDSRKAELQLRENMQTLSQARERLVQQASWLQALNSVAGEIARRNNLDSILQVVLGHLENSFEIAMAGVCLFSEKDDSCVSAALSARGRSLGRRLGFKLGDPLPLREIPRAAEDTQGTPQMLYLSEIDPASLSGEASRLLERLQKQRLQTLTIVDLEYEEIQTGILFMLFHDRLTHSEMECRYLKGMAEYMSVAIQNRRLYEELELSYLKLQQAQQIMMEQERMNAMGQMASGIAHDINNTLAPIALYTEALIASELGKSEPASRYLATIQSAVGDIEGITHRLRSFYTHEEAGELEPVDIGQVIEGVVELTRPRWKDIPNKRGIDVRLEMEVAPRLAPILGSRTEVREALINLVFNAVDALPEGGTITIRAKKHGKGKEERRLAVEVTDTGVGMEEEQRQRCLDPFYSTKGAEGSGLGLAVVYGTMQRHNGEIQIDSSPGGGTTVRLLFPLPHRPPGKMAREAEQSVELPALKILCVDDNPSVREALEEMLRQHGHVVESFGEGADAVVAFREAMERGQGFQVVITDLGMPHMDGREVARRVKEISPAVPVILLSGWGGTMNLNRELPQHVDCVLGKPPTIARVLTAIAEVLSRADNMIPEGEGQ